MTLPALTLTPAASTTTQLPDRPNSKPPPSPPQPQPPPQLQNHNPPINPNAKPISKHHQSSKPIIIDQTVSWTASISRHCRNGKLSQAAALFAQMSLSGTEPNQVTFITLLSGCADFPSQGKSLGPLLHAHVRKLGLDTDNVRVGTAVVDMYAKCGEVGLARLAFDELEVKNSVSWNTMIDGFMRNGAIVDAIELFDEMPQRDAVSWTVFIDGFVKRGHFEEALQWFREMKLCQVQPDYVTIVAVLAACANLGTLGLGLWIHRYVLKQEFRDNVKISNSLIDMYSRCGSIDLALQVFEKMVTRTVVSWNSVIVGFAANGFAEEALAYFELMQKEGFKPDGVTFTGVLTACSHAGLVDEGLKYFNIIQKVHRISPRIEHYGCMVDLYSRAGRLEDALNVVENMTLKPNEVVLGSLLAACRTHGNVHLAERLMNYIVEVDPGVDSNYVLLANIYAAVGNWEGASKVRRTMKALGIQKNPGCSSIEIGCGIHEFVAGEKSHAEMEHIDAMLELLYFDLKLCGYVPDTVLRDVNGND